MALGMEVGLGPGHIVLNWDLALLPPKRWHSPQFSAHVYCGQTAGWIKMPIGTEVGFDPGDIVLDGKLPPKGAQPQFSAHVYCGQTAVYSRIPLGREVGRGPGDSVFDEGPASPQKKGTAPSPTNFWPMSVARRLDGSRCHLVRRYTSAQATLC